MGKFDSIVELRFSRPIDVKGKTPRKSSGDPSGEGTPQQRRVEEAKWASHKMQSFAPAYDDISVQLTRRTPSVVLNDAAEQAQQEAIARTKRK